MYRKPSLNQQCKDTNIYRNNKKKGETFTTFNVCENLTLKYIEHRKLIHKYLDTISSLLVTALYTASQGVANISKYCCLQSQLNEYRAA